MTRKVENLPREDARSRKRILKPVVEKKRRDRINQSLSELRTLLLNSTCDPRLRNPKIEKAEILDLAVEYLQKWTKPTNDSLSSGQTELYAPEAASSSSLVAIESAGFRQCVAQLSSYMHKITPEQRTRLVEGLEQRLSATPAAASADAGEPPKLPFAPHPLTQPPSCSTPRHDYLSPPPSPWFSPLSAYATSPTFPSFACHFSFPPAGLSPPSAHTNALPQPSRTLPAPTPAPHLLRHPPPRDASPAASSIWRPWC